MLIFLHNSFSSKNHFNVGVGTPITLHFTVTSPPSVIKALSLVKLLKVNGTEILLNRSSDDGKE
ncbi:CLUMA_CG007675, isoform A [Clunio marinus]|uniref:CLUMA_CG007675, isoform A n=1 Tax=Clunio marinus TaxID=568069 RepID=A0A1J1I3I4_9DIPT|nr:CLUMA_CG007675, isoform A [Clunio marinus]